jgi:hypothetical protein
MGVFNVLNKLVSDWLLKSGIQGIHPSESNSRHLPQALVGQDNEKYLEGISLAIDRGLIEFACGDRSSGFDPFSHLDGSKNLKFDSSYTDRIDDFWSPLLLHLKSHEAPRILDFGAGAGVTASQLNRLIPHSIIHTVGLTPINPFLRFREDFHPRDFNLSLATHNHSRRLQEIFEETQAAYIQKQFIGAVPDEVKLPREEYDLIWENYGPLYHLAQSACSDGRWDGFTAAISAAMAALRDGGALVMLPSIIGWDQTPLKTLLVEVARKIDTSGVLLAHQNTVVSLRSESPVREIMEALGFRNLV